MDEQRAETLWQQAYQAQMAGRLADAIELYRQSIAVFPTAEAYTFLGWTYSMLDLYDQAIAMCKKAIEIDPGFGNPYNDIGAYLIELERWDEAIPWLEEATAAPRYEAAQFAYMNLGRVYEHIGDTRLALLNYERAIVTDPMYLPAEWARTALWGRLN